MVLLIGLINAGALRMAQGVGVMLGSEIGTGLAESPAVQRLLESCGSNVLLGVLVGAGVTTAIQSSSAMTAMVIAMDAVGVLTLPAVIALILGANIGTTVTAQIASIGSSLSSRRLAAAQLLTNVVGVAVFIPLVPLFAGLVELTASPLPRQIADAHTFFNITCTLALMPAVDGLVWLTKRLVRGRESTASAAPQHLSSQFLSAPTMALYQARQEILRMASMSGAMLRDCQRGLLSRDRSEVNAVFETETTVDGLKRSIEEYLNRISADGLSSREEVQLHVLQHVTGDVERVGNQAVNIAERTQTPIRQGFQLSDEAKADLTDLLEKTYSFYAQAIRALQEDDPLAAREALDQEGEVDRLERVYKEHHVQRLERGECDPESAILFAEILHNLERAGDHALNIACDVLHCS